MVKLRQVGYSLVPVIYLAAWALIFAVITTVAGFSLDGMIFSLIVLFIFSNVASHYYDGVIRKQPFWISSMFLAGQLYFLIHTTIISFNIE